MEKGVGSSLFVNDGSFMEKFKQGKVALEESKCTSSSVPSKPCSFTNKRTLDIKMNDVKKSSSSTSSGKLAFSLKQKSKFAVAPVKLGADEEEDEGDTENGSSEGPAKRQQLGQPEASEPSLQLVDVAYVLSIDLGGKRS